MSHSGKPANINDFLYWDGHKFVTETKFTTGGDLSGTNTSQTLSKIQGTTLTVPTLTGGEIMEVAGGAEGGRTQPQ